MAAKRVAETEFRKEVDASARLFRSGDLVCRSGSEKLAGRQCGRTVLPELRHQIVGSGSKVAYVKYINAIKIMPWLRGWRGTTSAGFVVRLGWPRQWQQRSGVRFGNSGNSSMPKDPMEKPDYPGEVGGFCPVCKERYGIEVRTIARRQPATKKLYFGCPNYNPPYNCRFNGCRDVVSGINPSGG